LVLVSADVLVLVDPLVPSEASADPLVSAEAPAEVLVSTDALVESAVPVETLAEALVSTDAPADPLVSTEVVAAPADAELTSKACATEGRAPSSNPRDNTVTTSTRYRCRRRAAALEPARRPRPCPRCDKPPTSAEGPARLPPLVRRRYPQDSAENLIICHICDAGK
jgi:hypothetical protein